jgi:hypothetical protein
VPKKNIFSLFQASKKGGGDKKPSRHAYMWERLTKNDEKPRKYPKNSFSMSTHARTPKVGENCCF